MTRLAQRARLDAAVAEAMRPFPPTLGELVASLQCAKAREDAAFADWKGPGDDSDMRAYDVRRDAEDALIAALSKQGVPREIARAMVWAVPDAEPEAHTPPCAASRAQAFIEEA